MHRRAISTRWTFVNKFIIPVLFVMATDAMAAILYVDGLWPEVQAELRASLPNRWVEIGVWGIWIVMFATIVRGAWLCKRIESDGMSLFISDYRQEVEVPIAEVIDAQHNVWLGAGLAWLKLDDETPEELRPWGQWIAFYPPARVTAWGWEKYRPHPIIAELLEDAMRQRRSRGHARIQSMAPALGRRGGFGYTRRL